jgi:hypothetical protein
MEQAFAAGYDPALELAKRSSTPQSLVSDDGHEGRDDVSSNSYKHLRRKEQGRVDHIVNGTETGRYYVFIGCKVNYVLVRCYLSFHWAIDT